MMNRVGPDGFVENEEGRPALSLITGFKTGEVEAAGGMFIALQLRQHPDQPEGLSGEQRTMPGPDDQEVLQLAMDPRFARRLARNLLSMAERLER